MDAHPLRREELGELSAQVLAPDYNGNSQKPTSLYALAVGNKPLEFHNHAGYRDILILTCPEGAELLISLGTREQAENDPEAFKSKMVRIQMAGNQLFYLSFHGSTFHEFGPIAGTNSKICMIAHSIHPDDLEGVEGQLLEDVKSGEAQIPELTDLAPPAVTEWISRIENREEIETCVLSC